MVGVVTHELEVDDDAGRLFPNSGWDFDNDGAFDQHLLVFFGPFFFLALAVPKAISRRFDSSRSMSIFDCVGTRKGANPDTVSEVSIFSFSALFAANSILTSDVSMPDGLLAARRVFISIVLVVSRSTSTSSALADALVASWSRASTSMTGSGTCAPTNVLSVRNSGGDRSASTDVFSTAAAGPDRRLRQAWAFLGYQRFFGAPQPAFSSRSS